MRRLFALLLFASAIAATGPMAHATVTYNAALASPGFYYGGASLNHGFTVDTENGVEIGLGAITRYVGTITPNGNVYKTSTGSAFGASVWGTDISINLKGANLKLSQVTATLIVTDNETGFTDTIPQFLTALTLPTTPSAGSTCYNGGTISNCTTISTGYSTAYGIQISEPGSLFLALGDTGFNEWAADTYLATLEVFSISSGALLASDTIEIDTVPEPASLAILVVAMAWISVVRRRGTAGKRLHLGAAA